MHGSCAPPPLPPVGQTVDASHSRRKGQRYMKQILQNLRSGEIRVADVPAPVCRRGCLTIRTLRTLISAGTERMLVEFGRASLLAKARSQPDRVKDVLNKIKTDGLLPTLDAVFKRLDEPLPLGYCNAGVVLEVGEGVAGFAPGERVISNGPHAEIVSVPKHLCAKIPEGVDAEHAAFTVLASIGLQGIRLVEPTMGEKIVVYGMGLIGLIAVQLFRACGCDVLGVDVNADRLRLAEQFGAETVNVGAGGDPIQAAENWTTGRGVDGVLICASAKTDEIVHASAEMCRKRGRIVLVGVVGTNLRRVDFYAKELRFQVSCSYGPGRYDETYEQGGQDYPPGFVRWTEQRNFDAVLQTMKAGRLVVDELITHCFPLENAASAYDKIREDPSTLGVVLEYPAEGEQSVAIRTATLASAAEGQARVGVIGAGNFSKMTLMPGLARSDARVAYVVDLNGAAAEHLASKFGAEQATTDYKRVLDDPEVEAIMIAVRHNLHARLLIETLQAGKHVFVEKPLAMNVGEIQQILAEVARCPGKQVMVGFNRRFSPHLVKMRQLLSKRSGPLCMHMLVNAGHVPPESWVHDPGIGGGRIVGEGCHFIDVMAFLTGSKVRTVSAAMVGRGPAVREDKMSITLGFEDGSVGNVNYFSNGTKSYPKERLQVFSDGRVLDMDNFRRTVGHGFSGFKKFKTSRQDKGHRQEFGAFVERVVSGGENLVPIDQLVNVTLASFAAMTSATEDRTITISQEYADVVATLGK